MRDFMDGEVFPQITQITQMRDFMDGVGFPQITQITEINTDEFWRK